MIGLESPSIVLIDEPSSGLDSHQALQVGPTHARSKCMPNHALPPSPSPSPSPTPTPTPTTSGRMREKRVLRSIEHTATQLHSYTAGLSVCNSCVSC